LAVEVWGLGIVIWDSGFKTDTHNWTITHVSAEWGD